MADPGALMRAMAGLSAILIPVALHLTGGASPQLAPGCHHALWETSGGPPAPTYVRIVECYAHAPGDDQVMVITNDGDPGARIDRGDVLIFGLARVPD